MEPDIWGPSAWIFLHSITLNYPDNPTNLDKIQYRNFFNSLNNVLPCLICKKNFTKHTNELPIEHYLESKKTLSKWLVNIHNKVNIQHNKRTLTYKKFLELYSNIYKKTQHYYYIIILAMMLCIIYLIIKFNYIFR